ncbi:hypothetical protein OXX69_003634 [Metschnikowia pulcherrima]
MNQTSTNTDDELHLHDKRHARGRFSWVKRLVQGPNKNMGIRTPPYEHTLGLDGRLHASDDNSTRKSLKSVEFVSDEECTSVHSDNISTTPLKSITSHTSTNSPSVLSGENHQDNSSMVASTAETSLSPSTHVSLSPSTRAQNRENRDTRENRENNGLNHSHNGLRDRNSERDRDSESIVTLASSTRRVRRRSIDTNCSMAGIPPASIMERLSVHPAAQNAESEAD